MRLSQYPYVEVRVSCRLCPRRGRYRLARLAERFGAEADLEHVLAVLSSGCRYQVPERRVRKYEMRCGVGLPDLDYGNLPPDVPQGGMAALQLRSKI